MANFWEKDPVAPAPQPVAGGGAGGLRQIIEPQPDRPPARSPTEEALIQERLRGEQLANQKRERDLQTTDTGKPLPAWAAKPYEDQIGVYAGLASAANKFQDEFGGNTVVGGLENTAQGLYSGIGTPGQRDWWAAFRTNDNIIRNQLFGATLTPSEQESYAATSINERMDPAEIRRNLQSRRDIVRKALARKTNFLRAQGYNSEAIDALAGEYASDFSPEGKDGRANAADAPPVVGGERMDASTPLPAGSSGGGRQPVAISETGEMIYSTDQDKRFGTLIQQAFDKGASKAQLDQLAVQYGYLPFSEDLDQAIQFRDRGGKGAKILPPESGYKGPSALAAMAATPVGSYFASAANGLTAGALDEIVGATGGDAEQAQAAKEVMRNANPISSFAGEVTGAGLAMSGLGRVPGLAGRSLATETAFGAAYGAGESNEDRVAGAALGGALGAGANQLVRGIGNIVARHRAPTPERIAGREALEAGQRQGIDMLPADVGGTFVRRMTGAAGQGPVSAIPIIRGAQQVSAQAQAARDRIATEIGRAIEPEAAGQAATRGARQFIGRTAARARTLYRQAESLASGATVPLPKATRVLDDNIAELNEVPGSADGLAALQALRQELDGQFTVQGVRGMRTQLRDRFISQGLRGSDLERRVNQVIDAASDDIADGLTNQGLGNAASAYRAADRYWRARVRTIDEALEPIIGAEGQKSGEEVIAALNRAAIGNNARLASFVRALPDEEQSIVRATFISQLGRANAGTQNAAGDAFSLPQFLTQWNKLTPGAKRTLFTGESRAALEDLARVAEGARAAQRFQNFSNTAGGVSGQLVIGGLPYAIGGLPYAVAALGSQFAVGTLLASPRFARWLARAPSTGMPPAYINRLERIAAAEAPIAAEVTGLRQALLSAANDNASKAASSPATSAAAQERE